MSSAVDIALARVSSAREEGFKPYPYDDATGVRVHAPKGNLTIGYGFNLDAPRSQGFWLSALRSELSDLDVKFAPFPWYQAANDARRSVFLDIAFNQGELGLMHYPHMLAGAAEGDWPEAAAQCSVKPTEPPGVIARYKRLSDILLSGVDSSYVP